MVIRRLLGFVGLSVILLALLSTSVYAAPSKSLGTINPRGLLVSPDKQFLSVDAGSPTTSSFSVANYTSSTIVVSLSVQQFNVANYSYNYLFSPPTNNWIQLENHQVQLAPRQSAAISYKINVPKGTKPGGNYFTFFASTTYSDGTEDTTAQAAILLYLTVNGNLIHSGQLSSQYLERLAFGANIAYSFDVTNTGNVYYFIYPNGKLSGWSAKHAVSPGSSIVMPEKIRKFSGLIPAPFIPGIYKATYGYTTDIGTKVQTSKLILFIPPWFMAAILLILIVIYNIRARRPARRKPKERQRYK
jgi:hypothetical protein